jgi:hypothetical protein
MKWKLFNPKLKEIWIHQNEQTNEDLALLKTHSEFLFVKLGCTLEKKLYHLRQYKLTVLHNNVFQLYQEWLAVTSYNGLNKLAAILNPDEQKKCFPGLGK